MFDDSDPWAMPTAIEFHACGVMKKPLLIVKAAPF